MTCKLLTQGKALESPKRQRLPEAKVKKELLWKEQLNTSLTELHAVQSEWLNISNTIETVVLWINVIFNKRRR